MEAAIEWSHRLLDVDEAVLFRRLSVFVGGFTLEGAEAVCVGEPIDGAAIRETLSYLVDKSLVTVETTGDAMRYRMLEPLREFAGDKLRESGETGDARSAHRSYVLRLTMGASFGLQVDATRLGVVVPELDNVEAALRFSIAQRDASAAMQIAINTYGVLRYLGRPAQARTWLTSALASTDERPSVLRAACLGYLGEGHLHAGDAEAAHAAYVQALEIFRAREFLPGLGWTLQAIADTLRSRGDVGAMRDACTEAIDIFRRLGDDEGLGWALANASGLSFASGLLEQSRSYAEACVALGEAAPTETKTRMDGLLGLLAAIRGDVGEGRRRYEVALRILEHASRFELHWLSMMVGAFEINRPELFSSGRRHLAVALEAVRGGGVARPVPWILSLAAPGCVDDGDMVRAARLFGASDSMLKRFDDESPLAVFAPQIDRARARCEAELGPRFAEESARGSVLTVPSAVDLCLATLTCPDQTR
jgi:tetratricopeptide (TPR) repeat protein